MNYIDMTELCDFCRTINDDVTCKECIAFDRCLLKKDKEKLGDKQSW